MIFSDPVYNYTREFPYLWEEIVLPIAYTDDRGRVEIILLAAAADDALVADEAAQQALSSMQAWYALSDALAGPGGLLADHRQLA